METKKRKFTKRNIFILLFIGFILILIHTLLYYKVRSHLVQQYFFSENIKNEAGRYLEKKQFINKKLMSKLVYSNLKATNYFYSKKKNKLEEKKNTDFIYNKDLTLQKEIRKNQVVTYIYTKKKNMSKVVLKIEKKNKKPKFFSYQIKKANTILSYIYMPDTFEFLGKRTVTVDDNNLPLVSLTNIHATKQKKNAIFSYEGNNQYIQKSKKSSKELYTSINDLTGLSYQNGKLISKTTLNNFLLPKTMIYYSNNPTKKVINSFYNHPISFEYKYSFRQILSFYIGMLMNELKYIKNAI